MNERRALAHRDCVAFRDLVEEALIGFYVSSPDGRLHYCNDAFVRLLGFASVDDAIGASLDTVYDTPADRDTFLARVRAAGSVQLQRVRLRTRDGRHTDVLESVVGEFDAAGELVELRGQVIDLTEHVAIEAALRDREDQFRAVFDAAAEAILLLDAERRIVDANGAAQTLFGVDRRELGARTLDSVLHADDRVDALWAELLALGEVKREHRLARGRVVRTIECSYRAHVRAGRHLCVGRDITERRLLDQGLQQSAKIEMVGRLAGGIAHDFNNLLTAILGYAELLLASRGPDDPERADIEEILKAGDRAAALTRQLLAFSRKQVLVPKDVDLNVVLETLRQILARVIREDITLVLEPARDPAVVCIDATQFEQVVTSLVVNARDAVGDDGRIVVSVARVDVGAGEIADVPAGRYVRVAVSDNGSGMPPDVRSHAFEPFFTTKELGRGTGLGLASAYGIVRQSNGYITIDSEPNVGTTVTMYFPCSDGVPAGAADPTRDAAGSGATILLVEDEDAVRVIVSTVLRRSGFRVLEASTPRGACEVFALHAQEIDLLLTDVVMPEMSGPALAQRLIADCPELRVLFISGYANVAGPAVESDNPNMAFLSKPFQASVLVDRVRELLRRPRRGPGLPPQRPVD